MSIKALVLGIGQAGNKIVTQAINKGVLNKEDCILINSTSFDFPDDYSGKKIVISPMNLGCGKERSISIAYSKNAIKQGLFNLDNINQYNTVCIVSSVEGGTGSGSAPILAQYFSQVHVKNVHIFAITGFFDDVRGLGNTIEFFKELNDNIIVHTISNNAFLQETHGNKMRAEELANDEFCKRYDILMGNTLIPSKHNIDDTDIMKLSNCHGYTTVEVKYLDKSLGDSDDYDKIVKRMIYESKSIKSDNPAASKIGVILNINEASREAISDPYSVIKNAYGMPYECFTHIQYDGKKEYIAFIISGMKLPIEELKVIYDKYLDQSGKVNKDSDNFFTEMKSMNLNDEDKKFDMLKPVKQGVDVNDFLAKF